MWRQEPWSALTNMEINTMRTQRITSLVNKTGPICILNHCESALRIKKNNNNLSLVCLQDVTAGWSTPQRWTAKKPCGRWTAAWSQLNGTAYYTLGVMTKMTTWVFEPSVFWLLRHRWLHCMTDDPPTTHPPEPKKFLAEIHQINVSATPQQYVPYSTTRQKIHEWVPPKAGAPWAPPAYL